MGISRRDFLKRSAVAGTTVFLGSSFAGCLGNIGNKGPIEVGVILSLTGDLGSYGLAVKNGIVLAAKHINENGGVLGREFRLLFEDDQTSKDVAKSIMQKFVEVNQVPAVVGAMGSDQTLAMMPIGRDNKVLMISPSSTSITLTDADDDDFLFRTCSSDAFQGEVMVKVALDMGFTRVSHLFINNDYGIAMNDVVKDDLQKRGGYLLNEVPYDPGKSSYGSELSSLTLDDPEALIFTGYPQSGAEIFRQAWDRGIRTQWVLSEGLKDQLLVEKLGNNIVDGMVGTSPIHPGSSQYDAFLKAYNEDFDSDPGLYSDTAYDATMLVALSIERAGKAEGSAIRDVLRDVSLEHKSVSGSVEFDENGDVTSDFVEWEFACEKIVIKRLVSR